MANISSLDLKVRLQLLGEAYATILNKYTDSLRFSKKDKLNLKSKLLLLGIYIEILSIYNVDECGYDSSNNCITEDEAQVLCDNAAKLANVCFQPLGFNYIGSDTQSGISKFQIGCNFVVS
jgi:hypothetical protein